MNKPAVTKEELLQTAESIMKRDGLEQPNIRRLAKECRISVGCIYNYFPSKADLIFTLTERFWYQTIHQIHFDSSEGSCFLTFLAEVYQRLFDGFQGFSVEFLEPLTYLNQQDKIKGKKKETEHWIHMKTGLQKILEADPQIDPSVWNETLHETDFIEFVFDTMLMLLKKGAPDCSLFLEIIRRTLYL